MSTRKHVSISMKKTSIAIITLAALLAPLPLLAQSEPPFTVTNAITRRAVFSCTDFTFSDGVVDSLGISNNVIGNDGDVGSNGNVKMSGGAVVYGDATAGPGKAVTNSGSSRVTGTKSVAAAAEICMPIDLTSLVPAVQATNDNSRIPLTGGGKNPMGGSSHTEFTLSGGDTITFAPGTYYFTKFTVSGGSTITLTGPTRFLCTGRADISGGSFANPQPYRFRFWVSGAGPFTLSGGSTLSGFVYAPSAASTISSARLIGSIFADKVTISGGSSHVSRAIDDIRPGVSITQPANGTVVADPAHVLVKGTVSDDEGPVTVQVNGQAATVNSDGTFQITLNLSGASPATITAVATDLSGNSNSAQVTVTTVPPPVLTLSSPAPGSWVNTRVVDLSGGSGNAVSVTVNGQAAVVSAGVWSLASFDLGADGAHTLTIIGTNSAGVGSTINPVVSLDTVAPTIQRSISPAANAAGWNNSDVTVSFTCADSGSGIATCPASVTVTAEGAGLTVSRTAVDRAGNSTPLTVTLNIDQTVPHPTFTSHTNNQVVSSRTVTVKGGSDDAETVTVNGVSAVVDQIEKTFTAEVSLLEGENTITAEGIDRATNAGSTTLKLVLDTRAPELAITAPSANACIDNDSIELRGTVSDPNVDKITVTVDGTSTQAGLDAARRNWTATVALGAEGRKSILVETKDTSGHTATRQLTLTVDRTDPVIEITESGAPFTSTLVAHPVTLFFRATDADANATLTATLGSSSVVSGVQVSAETSHTLTVTATDCAGNRKTETRTFTIDVTAPHFLTFTPASGSKVAQIPESLSGTTDSDVVEVRVAGRAGVPVTNGAFTLAGVGFADGVNELTLEAVDRAGNIGRASYTLGIRTTKPLIEIVEGGQAMVEGATYNRAVTPRVRVFEEGVTFTATLDGTAFNNDRSVSENGAHVIVATATDAAYGQTNAITRHFTIDRSAPAVKITAPANNATFEADRVNVNATAEDAVSVSVNGIPAVKNADNSWTAANVPLEMGENDLVAAGRDSVGNTAHDAVVVNRSIPGPALVLTFPPNPYTTNRPRVDVMGRVLRPSSTVAVTVPPANAVSVAPDAAGMFKVTGATLREGTTTITAVATDSSGKSTSVTTSVIADFTPPRVRILESGAVFAEGAHFGAQAVIGADATDNNAAIPFTFIVDGNSVTTLPLTISAAGGHTAVITARDAAGNESRLERTFTVGNTAGGGCRLEGFDPPDQSVITGQKVELIGRSGGAAGVKVNGIAAKMSNGSFCATVELPVEGANSVRIVCTDAAGTETGDPVTITLIRATNDPSVTITTPGEDSISAIDKITVTGTLGNGATTVDVNGTPATISGSNWTAANVRLRDGVNILVAHASANGGRTATASRRVTLVLNAPSISISSPIPGYLTGTATVDVSGTWSNVDPSSLTIAGLVGQVEPTPWSDTTGRFIARNVPLVSGDNTITVTGRDRTGRLASANVLVKYASTNPTISITDPIDNKYFPASAGSTFRLSGSYSAGEGAAVDVGGTAATQDQTAKTFFGDVPFSTLAGGMTPAIARVTEPGGAQAFDTIRVFKLAEAPKVVETFPAANALEVDRGVVTLVLFSNPMDVTTLTDAFRLENASGTAINGKSYLDKDVLTFAPATILTPGERYTIRVTTAAKDLAGQSLASEFTSSFTVATTAPGTAPTLTTASGRFCGQLIDVAGTTAPSARVRLDYGSIFFVTQANSSGAFSYKVALTGTPGYHVIRVRTVGADGTLSPFVELKINLDCTGPKVLSSSYDRSVNKLTIVFSSDMKADTLTTGTAGSVQLEMPDSRIVGGTVAVTGANAVVTPAEDLSAKTFTLKISTAATDTQGRKLDFPYTNLFAYGDDTPQPGDGKGFITGEVYDATNGRPLAGAEITIEAPEQSVTMTTDSRGRYGDRFPEGAHTIRAAANGYTTVWRQIIVPAGAGVIPIDIRLTKRGDTKSMTSGALTLSHGANNAVTRHADLNIPAGAINSSTSVTLTSVGAQSLAGLLPLGWSPLASAEIVSTATTLGASTLTFDVPQTEISAASQTLAAVRYDASRDEWRVITPVVNIAGDKAAFNVSAPGAYALVYPDKRSGLTSPQPASSGAPLQGVADRCADGTCPAMQARSFPLSPSTVLPTESTIATLNIEGSGAQPFPSGTAVQAYIEEELRLADGGNELGFPFATDLLLYRDLAGNTGVAAFNLAPSTRAAEVFLEVGFEHLRILPYPGRLDRGTLVGPEGGRVPGDDKITVEIPAGATPEALSATTSSLTDPTTLGPIAGYRIVGGFQLTLQRVGATTPADNDGDGQIDAAPAVELTRPASATFTIDPTKLPALSPSQLILVELIDQTPFGNRVFRLASEMTALDAARWSTKAIDRNVLPVDGVMREGRYLLLAADAPIGFAKGVVRIGATGAAAVNARVTASGLGVADLTRTTGIFNVPVQATPATGFSLIPRTVALGDGAAYQKSPAPAPNEVVNVGDLVLVAQPPHVSSTIPSNNDTNVGLSTTVEARLEPGIDPASVNATTLVVLDTATGKTVTGTVSAIGNTGVLWKLPAGGALSAGTRYVATVSPALRGINGTPLGQSYAFSFTTATTFTNSEIHPEKIKITIPDANGLSKITGAAGALPANWVAIPVRRVRDFGHNYSGTAASDGAFSITINQDRVTFADEIDLRVLNNNGALSAIIPLTPFVAENGRAFVAPANRAVTFTSADGIAVAVPAGAFEQATLIEMAPAPAAVFDVVPNINNELTAAATVELKFEGRAKVPLELTFPAPGASGQYFLGVLGDSVRGPRIMAVDTLAIVNGTLTTVRQSTSGARTLKPTQGLARFDDPKDVLLRVIEQGSYAAYQMKTTAASHGMVFAFMDGLTQNVDLFWDTMYSMYVGHRYVAEALGRIAFPVPAGTAFTVEGVDPATSLSSFKTTYDPIPLGDPGKGVVIANPATDFNGPHPVFGTPFRVEIAEVPPAGVTLQSIRDIQLVLNSTGMLTVQASTGSSLTALTKVSALDVNNGEHRGPQSLPLTLNAKPGDRVIIMIDEKDVDATTPLSIVFNEAIDIGTATTEKQIDEALKKLIRFEQLVPGGGTPIDLLPQALLRLDSNGRRVSILLPSALAAGERFKLTLDTAIQDRSTNGLLLGQAGEKSGATVVPIGPTPAPMELQFETRGPKGNIADFNIHQSPTAQFGAIREMTSFGNLLFIAAVDGGILAYDTSNPAALDESASPLPVALAPGRDSDTGDAVTDYWSVQVDRHGRVYAAGRTNLFGVLRTFRVEDFIKAKTATSGCLPTIKNTVCKQTGSTILSQNIGTSYGYGLGSAFVTADRVEAIPRKVRIVVGDSAPVDYDRDTFVSAFSSGSTCVSGAPSCTPDELHKFDAKLPATTSQYRIQRVTVENVTLGLKWSADARATTDAATLPDADLKNIIAGPKDTLRVTYNQSTYAVVTLFGYGIGVFDVNAVESNDATQAAGTTSADRPQEQIALRPNAFDDPSAASSTSISSLAYSPESAIMNGPGNSSRVYALDAKKGVADFVATPPASISRSGELILTGGANARFDALKSAIITAGLPAPLARFNTADTYYNPNTKKDYLLMPALDFGLFVVEAGAVPLMSDSFADVVWLPEGAHAVRVVDGTNMAVVIDGKGHAALIDLSRIDERIVGGTATTGVFPTAKAALLGTSGYGGYGANDPRILWRSTAPVGMGQVAPVVDAETGFLYGADFLAQRVHVASAIDPKMHFVISVGSAGLKEVGSIVPLGIAPPTGVLQCDLVTDPDCGASLGVFRVEARLPGSIVESLPPAGFQIAIESELVPGADTPQTPDPYPVAHLRYKRRDGNVDARPQTSFALKRAFDIPSIPELRYQKGYNRYVSDWIVAIADPRAAKDYNWGTTSAAEKENLGCFACERPKVIKNDTNAKELYTAGHFISARPEEISASNVYAWLSEKQRLRARAGTIIADTVRPANVLIAAQNPPVAGGVLQETTYLHSGEVGHDAVDLDAGGRAGWNVIVDRAYRSRSLGFTPLGIGWDSGIFKRLRALPNGDVEYRDGSGEVFRYVRAGTEYTSPKGYFARLARYDGGWVMTDQKLRVTYFDDYGRVVREGDEFFTPDGKGNQIVYVYDSKGRLDTIIDPNERANRLHYFEGISFLQKEGWLKDVEDWRTPARKLAYDYDTQGRLTNVFLPEFRALLGTLTKPERRYAYDTGSAGNYADKLELSSNLLSVIEPDRAPFNGPARVAFTYTGPRDYVKTQKWATGEEATFTFTPGTNPTAETKDVLGQQRKYTFKMPPVPAATEKYKWYTQDRPHVLHFEETNVDTYKDANFGALPASIAPNAATTEPKTRSLDFGYDDDGLMETATLAGVSTTQYTFKSAGTNLGKLLSCIAVGPAGSSPCTSGATVQTTYNYNGTYLQSTTANGKTIESPEAHRDKTTLTATNSSVTTTTTLDLETGLAKEISTSGGTAGDPTASKIAIDYPPTPPSDLYKRGLPTAMHIGTSALSTSYTYLSQDKDLVDDGRNSTTTTYDEWRRPIQIKITNNAGDPLTIEKAFVYDPNGRIHEQRDRQTTLAGNETVTTTYDYDATGRVTSVKTDNVDVNGTSSTITQTTDYSQFAAPTRKIVTTPPGGSEITSTLDTLGRTKETKQSYESGKFLINSNAYDLAGNAVYTTDQKNANAFAFDHAGRMTDALSLNGTREKMDYDGWSRTTDLHLLDSAGNEYYRKHIDFTPTGKAEKITESGTGFTRDIAQQWDGAGRPVHLAATASSTTDGGRAMFLQFDDAGRLKESRTGQGTISTMGTVYERKNHSLYGSTELAKRVEQHEPKSTAPSTYVIDRDFDTLGNAKSVKISALQWQAQFDQNGNPIKSSVPGRPTTQYEYDSQGKLIRETLPDGSIKNHQHNETGAKVLRIDEETEKTKTDTDDIGRPKTITYHDLTTEEFVYDGPRLVAIKNRQGRWQSFEYNGKAQLVTVYAASAPIAGAAKLDEITYDEAGRLKTWRTKDALIEYSGYTGDNLPRTTKQTRFKNAGGFTTADILDSYTVEHDFNGYGELTDLTMPGAPAGDWAKKLHFDYDSMGNLIELQRDGETLLKGEYRNARRPDSRTVFIKPQGCATSSCLKQLVRTYGYKPETSQLEGMVAKIGTIEIAGSKVKYEDTLQVTEEELAGVSGGTNRHTRYSYDSRGRLFGSVTAVSDNTTPPTPTTPGTAVGATPGVRQDLMSSADFRKAQERTPAFDTTARDDLKKKGIDPDQIDPPGSTADPQAGHKISKFTKGPTAEDFRWTKPDGTGDGDVRTEDGRFKYSYDEKRRLVWVAEKVLSTASPIRRILYSYDANDRLVGRTAQYATLPTLSTPYDTLTWQTEDRPTVIAADGVAPELTFVWDPVTDRLLSIFKSGASASPIDPNKNLLRQFIHGDLGLDDPIEITTPDLVGVIPPGGAVPVTHVYPVYDEAGNGTLQVVLNRNGEVVSRHIATDPYGAEEFELAGAAIDQVQVIAKKTATGVLQEVRVQMRATEALRETTIGIGSRLAILNSSGGVVAQAPAPAVAVTGDPFRLEWNLAGTAWNTFVNDGIAAGGKTLSIAVTSQLRAGAWAVDVPVLPAPAWASAIQPVFTSGSLPVEVRESLSTFTTFIAGVSNNSQSVTTPYEVTGLGSLGVNGGNGDADLFMAASFHAQPFQDPFSGKNYVRERWFDPITATWMTPDPLGYLDSSNLYAFAGGDPINGRDPLGMGEEQSARAGEALARDPKVQCAMGRIFGSLKATGKIGWGFVTGAVGLVRGAFGDVDPAAANAALDDAQDFIMHPVKRYYTVMDRVQAAEDEGDCFKSGETLHGQYTGPITVVVVGTVETVRGAVRKPPAAEPVKVPVEPVEPVKPTNGVKPLEVDSFENLKAREVKGDGLEHDHVPSYASLRAAKEQALGRPLTEAEAAELYKKGTAIEVPKDVHRQGRTHGGKNTKKQVAADSANLSEAERLDLELHRQNLVRRGFSPEEVNRAIEAVKQRNRKKGVTE